MTPLSLASMEAEPFRATTVRFAPAKSIGFLKSSVLSELSPERMKLTVWSARSSRQKRSTAPRQHRTGVENDAAIAAVSGKAGIGLISACPNVGKLDLAGGRSQIASKIRQRIAWSRVGSYAQDTTASNLQITAAKRILVVESQRAALHDRVARVSIGCRQA